jgi:hypothetical protein
MRHPGSTTGRSEPCLQATVAAGPSSVPGLPDPNPREVCDAHVASPGALR